MSYLVLARKYRPRRFTEMVGQEHVVQALSNALSTGRLHHAWLFTGTRGVGKTTVSRILAKSLNCQGPDGQGGITASPCGVCPACTDIDSGRFVDYTELDAASNRSVDEMQSLLEQAVYKPVQGRFKVFMIDEVHMLTGHAFNAMLKTLEEPPDYLKFVLATTDPQKVPVTVLSRCLQFNLRPMAPETVREHLQRVLQAEQVVADDAALWLLARAARGSMRDALSLTDQAIAFGAGVLHEASVRSMLGSVDRGRVSALVEALARGDGPAVVQTCDELRLHGQSAAAALEDMAVLLHRMAVWQVMPVDAATPDADPDLAQVRQLAAAMPPDETQLLYSLCLHGRAELGLAPDEYAALTMVLLRLLAFKPGAVTGRPQPAGPTRTPADSRPAGGVTVATPVVPRTGRQLPVRELVATAAPASQENRPQDPVPSGSDAMNIEAVPVRRQADSAADLTAPGVAVEVAPTEDGDFWHTLVQQLVEREAVSALARELALQAQLVARDIDHWLLRVERESLNQPGARERLTAALSAAGYAVTLTVEVGRVLDSPARRLAAAAAQRQLAAEKLIFEDSFVQSVMRDFGAKIVPGSIKAG